MTLHLEAKDFTGLPKIVENIADALDHEKPFSLVRIGDAANIVLGQELVFSQDWIAQNVGWSHSTDYCGVALPNLEIRDRMVKALHQADIIGVFPEDQTTIQVLSAHNIVPKGTCYAFENLYMPMYKPFVDLIRRYPPLLVGRPSEEFAAYLFAKLGVKVPGIVSINSYDDIDTCLAEMSKIPHQWSFISAGISGDIIATTMATEFGKVSVDFGHAPDNVMSPDFIDYWLTVD